MELKKTILEAVKNPMAYVYAGAFSVLAGATNALGTKTLQEAVERGASASLKNLLFFGPVNIGYAKAIDYAVKKFDNHPYLAANAICLAVNAGFAGYAYLTGDNKTDLQAVLTSAAPVTALGLALTNRQVGNILKNQSKGLEDLVSEEVKK